MNKAKFILLAAGVSLAMAITISCSSVDNGGGGNEGAAISCKTDNACVEVSADACLALQGQLVASCGTSSLSSSSIGGGGSSSSVSMSGSTITYGGQTYKTVRIGPQTWMAENLNYNASGSRCYGEGGEVYDIFNGQNTLSSEEIQANCDKYGRLYDWNTAMDACPPGWRLPSEADWNILSAVAGGSENLRAVDGWDDCGPSKSNQYKCYDIHGFAALPGGRGLEDDSYYFFYDIGHDGNWWSATENDAFNAYDRSMRYYYSNEYLDRNIRGKSVFLSVRCLQDRRP